MPKLCTTEISSDPTRLSVNAHKHFDSIKEFGENTSVTENSFDSIKETGERVQYSVDFNYLQSSVDTETQSLATENSNSLLVNSVGSDKLYLAEVQSLPVSSANLVPHCEPHDTLFNDCSVDPFKHYIVHKVTSSSSTARLDSSSYSKGTPFKFYISPFAIWNRTSKLNASILVKICHFARVASIGEGSALSTARSARPPGEPIDCLQSSSEQIYLSFTFQTENGKYFKQLVVHRSNSVLHNSNSDTLYSLQCVEVEINSSRHSIYYSLKHVLEYLMCINIRSMTVLYNVVAIVGNILQSIVVKLSKINMFNPIRTRSIAPHSSCDFNSDITTSVMIPFNFKARSVSKLERINCIRSYLYYLQYINTCICTETLDYFIHTNQYQVVNHPKFHLELIAPFKSIATDLKLRLRYSNVKVTDQLHKSGSNKFILNSSMKLFGKLRKWYSALNNL